LRSDLSSRSHLDLAELLVDGAGRGDLVEARRHLDVAISELRQMNMQSALERALNLADRPQLNGLATTSARTSVAENAMSLRCWAGKSNRQIADALVISEGTVEVHVKHILSKLGLRSRAQVAAWSVQHEVSTSRTPTTQERRTASGRPERSRGRPDHR
jgi:DNA-binding CsgD family transcriptional regulator